MSVAETNVARLCLALQVLRAASVNFGAVAGNRQCIAGQSEDKRRSRGKRLITNWLSRGISGVRSTTEGVSHSLLSGLRFYCCVAPIWVPTTAPAPTAATP